MPPNRQDIWPALQTPEANPPVMPANIKRLVIVDEAHHLKNSRIKAHQLVSRLKKKYILLLTATPVENDLSELFNLITLLLPGQLETASSFKRKYVTRGNPAIPSRPAAGTGIGGGRIVRRDAPAEKRRAGNILKQ